MPMILHNIYLFILGLAIGSFLNVCIYRIPQNRTVVTVPSHCPLCNNPIAWHDLIPLVSYIILRGKCRRCKGHISISYPIVELLNAVCYLLIFHKSGFTVEAAAMAVLASALIVAAGIDLNHQLIPDKVVVFIIASGLAFMPFRTDLTVLDSVMGFIAAGLLMLFFAVISKGGMGGGDIKLMAAAGLFLGWKLILLSLFAASVFGSIAGILMIVFKKKDRKDFIPFGPYLAAGIFICGLYGSDFLIWYLGLIG